MCGGGARSCQLLLSGCALPMALGSKVDRWSLNWGRQVGGMRVVLLLREKWHLRIPGPDSLPNRNASEMPNRNVCVLIGTHTYPLPHGSILKPTNSEL